MQLSKRMLRLLLLPGLIWFVSSACGLGSSESSPEETSPEQEAATEQQAAEAPTQTKEPAETPEPTAQEPQAAESQEPVAVRAATTVFAATQVLDLRYLFLPTEIKSMGQSEAGTLNFELPTSDVASVVDMYQPYFIEQGWQNDAELEYTGESTANRYFYKDDFIVSMSVSSSDGAANVMFVNHGNIDLRALPQMADAESVIAFPQTLTYFSPSGVAEVADFTRQGLTAQGWVEYTRPNTATADDPDNQLMTFIQNGMELWASVGAAPAQDGKTSVQYSALLLPADMPMYADGRQVEFDSFEPYLSYQTEADTDTLIDFYREQMPATGWTEMADAAAATEAQAALFFAHEAQNLALMLEILPGDGQQTVTLRSFEADEMLALQDEADTADTDNTEDSGDTPSDVMPGSVDVVNLPIAADATGVDYDDLSEQIIYTSPSDIETLTDFYRQALAEQGWQENEVFSYVDETFASLEFEQDDASLTVDMFNYGSGETEVTLYGYGLMWGTAGDETIAGDSTTQPSAASEPLSLIEEDEILLPSNNSGYFSEGSQFSTIANITSPSAIDDLVALYQTGLPDYGWQPDDVEAGSETELYFIKEGQELGLLFREVGSETEIEFALRNPAAAAEAGILPPAGQAKLMVINFTEDTLTMTVNQETLEIPGGGTEIEDPADVPQFDVAPGQHTITTILPNGESLTDTAEVGANQVWTLWVDEEGALPVRLY